MMRLLLLLTTLFSSQLWAQDPPCEVFCGPLSGDQRFVFTPNGDDYQDTWTISYPDSIHVYEFNMKIFDEGDDLIYETYEPGFVWKGRESTKNERFKIRFHLLSDTEECDCEFYLYCIIR